LVILTEQGWRGNVGVSEVSEPHECHNHSFPA